MDTTGRRHKALKSIILLLILALAVNFLLPQLTELGRSLVILRSFAKWALLSALIAQIISYVGNGYVTSAIVELFGKRLPLLYCVKVVVASFSFSLIWGGQLTYTGSTFRWLHKAGVRTEAALLSGLVPAVFNIFTIGVISTFGFIYLLLVHKLSVVLASAFVTAFLLLFAMGCLVWLGIHNQALLVSIFNGVGRLWAKIRHKSYNSQVTEETIQRVFIAWSLLAEKGWKKAFFGDIINVGFDVVTFYMLFLAAGYFASFGIVLVGYGLPLLVGKISPIPGGVGVVEGTMLALYQGLGVPSAISVVVILTYRLISFWVPVILGFLLIPSLNRQSKEINDI